MPYQLGNNPYYQLSLMASRGQLDQNTYQQLLGNQMPLANWQSGVNAPWTQQGQSTGIGSNDFRQGGSQGGSGGGIPQLPPVPQMPPAMGGATGSNDQAMQDLLNAVNIFGNQAGQTNTQAFGAPAGTQAGYGGTTRGPAVNYKFDPINGGYTQSLAGQGATPFTQDPFAIQQYIGNRAGSQLAQLGGMDQNGGFQNTPGSYPGSSQPQPPAPSGGGSFISQQMQDALTQMYPPTGGFNMGGSSIMANGSLPPLPGAIQTPSSTSPITDQPLYSGSSSPPPPPPGGSTNWNNVLTTAYGNPQPYQQPPGSVGPYGSPPLIAPGSVPQGQPPLGHPGAPPAPQSGGDIYKPQVGYQQPPGSQGPYGSPPLIAPGNPIINPQQGGQQPQQQPQVDLLGRLGVLIQNQGATGAQAQGQPQPQQQQPNPPGYLPQDLSPYMQQMPAPSGNQLFPKLQPPQPRSGGTTQSPALGQQGAEQALAQRQAQLQQQYQAQGEEPLQLLRSLLGLPAGPPPTGAPPTQPAVNSQQQPEFDPTNPGAPNSQGGYQPPPMPNFNLGTGGQPAVYQQPQQQMQWPYPPEYYNQQGQLSMPTATTGGGSGTYPQMNVTTPTVPGSLYSPDQINATRSQLNSFGPAPSPGLEPYWNDLMSSLGSLNTGSFMNSVLPMNADALLNSSRQAAGQGVGMANLGSQILGYNLGGMGDQRDIMLRLLLPMMGF